MPRRPSGQGERTRARLLEAARAVFAERGWGPTRVDDIARRAGTSHGTFYLYFRSKEDILEALATSTAEEAMELARAFEEVVQAPDRHAALRGWVTRFFELNRRDWPVLAAWIQAEATSPRLRRLGASVLAGVARQLAAAIAEASGDHRVDPAVAATALVAMLERFSYFWLVRGARFDAQRVVATMATLLEGAIFTRAGGRVRSRAEPRLGRRAGSR